VLGSPPELGRCEKLTAEVVGGVKTFHGAFGNSKCTVQASGARYEWYSGVLATGFTLQASAAVLETAAGATVTCTAEHASGTFSSAKTLGSTVIKLTGCESAGHKCTTKGRPAGEIESEQLEGEIGWISKTAKKTGLVLRPAVGGGPFMEYFCGSSLFTVTGTVAVPLKVDKTSSSQILRYKAKHGVQRPEGLEGATSEPLTSTPFGEPSERIAITAAVTLTFEEGLEVNAFF